MLIIGERINASRKSIAQAVLSEDRGFIQKEATAQHQAGADYLDVNAGTFVEEEAERLRWVVEVVQEVTDLPLCIDSPNPETIKAVLPFVKKRPIINSITLEPERLKGVLPLVVEYKAKVIGLCQSEGVMAKTAEQKVELAKQLVENVTAEGIDIDDLYIDPLVYPLSTDTHSAVATLEAIQSIMKEFPGLHTTCGLTNVSYGLPNRKLVNRTFLVSAVARGLDCAILDPTDKALYGALSAALMIMGEDDFCMAYLSAFREGRLGQ
ncbi:MAG: methyltetrahydrofolate cobalamin methyltransferase [Deltaproteobacteria bacterium]|nr:MAG: methyltetrahydrofolate cobalamin methyltransferase [Deltaproteobacteria bacterium]